MKAAILFLLVLSFSSVRAQDTLRLTASQSIYTKVEADNDYHALYIRMPDSVLVIHGDTMKVIRILLERLRVLDSTELALWKFIRAGIDFSNYVPDYFKTKAGNCKWPQYYAVMKKNGYRTVKVKQPAKKEDCK